MFFALIQIISDCKIVKNLSFSTLCGATAFVYLSAYSQAVTKSIHFIPKIARSCSFRSARLKGTWFMIYGKSTWVGRHSGSGPQIVTILHPSCRLPNLFFIFSIISISVNQNRIAVASSIFAVTTSSHKNFPSFKSFSSASFFACWIFSLLLSTPIAFLT
uniref:Uncharacterized protein n=1 Tax=uncultured marine crenarchaeote HF4000_ANIW137N18 TaxID=455576 RepID=B3T507_9ARCH|nr:hypothetical protein ALOHA_HF4000ANIW137N18ctg2g9 [uncultured marine crenarchaeote HF4000_ANIW137N18]